jgi:hypothetical protein
MVIMFSAEKNFDVISYAAEFSDVQDSVFPFILYDCWAAISPVSYVVFLVFRDFICDSQLDPLLVQILRSCLSIKWALQLSKYRKSADILDVWVNRA